MAKAIAWHGIYVKFGHVERLSKQAASRKINWYDTYFKHMHWFDGTRVETRYDPSLKGFDEEKAVKDKDGNTVYVYKKQEITVECPFCKAKQEEGVEDLVKRHGLVMCRGVDRATGEKCGKRYAVSPKSQKIVPVTFNVTVREKVSGRDTVLRWLLDYSRNSELRLDFDLGVDGMYVECVDYELDDFLYGLDRAGIEYTEMGHEN